MKAHMCRDDLHTPSAKCTVQLCLREPPSYLHKNCTAQLLVCRKSSSCSTAQAAIALRTFTIELSSAWRQPNSTILSLGD